MVELLLSLGADGSLSGKRDRKPFKGALEHVKMKRDLFGQTDKLKRLKKNSWLELALPVFAVFFLSRVVTRTMFPLPYLNDILASCCCCYTYCSFWSGRLHVLPPSNTGRIETSPQSSGRKDSRVAE